MNWIMYHVLNRNKHFQIEIENIIRFLQVKNVHGRNSNSVRDSVDPFVQSISTHYSCFEKMDWFVALQKAGCKKNRVIVIGKKKEASNNDPGFCILLLATHILDLF